MTGLDASRVRKAIQECNPLVIEGRVIKASGLIMEATLPSAAIGTACEIEAADGRFVGAEVVGFSGSSALLMPFGDIRGIRENCAVRPKGRSAEIPMGNALLGRVVDSSMRPLDGGAPPVLGKHVPLDCSPPVAMSRRRISRVVATGIRSIDAFLTFGEGQRLGIMAGPGVGKSVLLGMLARHAEADVIVVGLIGERGREVREFVERDLGASMKRSVVVVATADEPPLVRVRAGMAATATAEHFRAQGKRVLLLVDSLSRICMAQREIGLAAGEPPTSKGYPPSAFAGIPRLVERAGNDSGPGSITALYTLLAEGDDMADPVVDTARAALDGHIILSRRLGSSGHYPAIDVLPSVSRVMNDIVTPEHRRISQQARELLATYAESSDLIEVGAYVAGSNPRVDRALRAHSPLQTFLRQSPDETTQITETLIRLGRLVSDGAPP
jgi:flagellum-specific ATP synthase